jgi:hypothetical protein
MTVLMLLVVVVCVCVCVCVCWGGGLRCGIYKSFCYLSDEPLYCPVTVASPCFLSHRLRGARDEV